VSRCYGSASENPDDLGRRVHFTGKNVPYAPGRFRARSRPASPRLRRPVRLTRIASAILVNKPPVRAFNPARNPRLGQGHGLDRFASFSLSPTPRSIPHRYRDRRQGNLIGLSWFGASPARMKGCWRQRRAHDNLLVGGGEEPYILWRRPSERRPGRNTVSRRRDTVPCMHSGESGKCGQPAL
jgi:hypothetical protein